MIYIKGDDNIFILNERFRISVELKNRKSLIYYLKRGRCSNWKRPFEYFKFRIRNK